MRWNLLEPMQDQDHLFRQGKHRGLVRWAL
jgi:hypothetical protein